MGTRALLVAIGLSLISLDERARAQGGPVFTAEDLLQVRTFAGGQPVAAASTGRWVA